MVTWTHRVADLLAIGVHIDVEAIHVLEKGGEVLTLEILPAPDSFLYGEGESWPVTDSDGEVLMMPYTLKVIQTDELFYKAQSANTITVAEQLEENVGDIWRLFPSYVGDRDVSAYEDPRGYGDDPIPIRIWNAIPLLTQEDRITASLIISAHRRMLGDSYYEDLIAFYQTHIELVNGWSDFNIDDLTNEQSLQYWEQRTKLAQMGYIMEVRDDHEDWVEGRPIDFDPIELYLKDHGARRMWAQLLHVSRQASTRVFHSVPLARQSQFVHEEKEYEPWF